MRWSSANSASASCDNFALWRAARQRGRKHRGARALHRYGASPGRVIDKPRQGQADFLPTSEIHHTDVARQAIYLPTTRIHHDADAASLLSKANPPANRRHENPKPTRPSAATPKIGPSSCSAEGCPDSIGSNRPP